MKKKHQHHPETAGYHMNSAVPCLDESTSIGKAKKYVLDNIRTFESVHYLYAIDSHRHLTGVISMKELLSASGAKALRHYINQSVIAVFEETDQEDVASLAIKHGIKAIPVIDKERVFKGVVTSDKIMAILREEHVEDLLKQAGIRVAPHLAPVQTYTQEYLSQLAKRLPWLILGLTGGFVAASVVTSFEHLLATNVLLAAFIPAVVYMADAVGSQAQTLYIRAVALDKDLPLLPYLLREILINSIIALILGLGVAGVVGLLHGDFHLGGVVGISMALTIVAASITAVILPWLCIRIKADPAVASGPFATVVRDIMSLLIYFAVAAAFFL